jgi:hypothetical protein
LIRKDLIVMMITNLLYSSIRLAQTRYYIEEVAILGGKMFSILREAKAKEK